jgi:UDP-3-O-[3-hydroxymyristoyl] N-acetylglucosamine deacetylase/3-hydroxyacyl-[acyl-carrier-protein] dehydratase
LNKKNKFVFKHTNKYVYDINNIMKIISQKYPFIYVDKILKITDKNIIGIKNVTINEHFFIGHFPNKPIMPGVLQIEAIAQIGGLLFLNKIKNPKSYFLYLIKIEEAKFKKKIIPGDTILFKINLLKNIKKGILNLQGMGYVNTILAVEAKIIIKIVKN